MGNDVPASGSWPSMKKWVLAGLALFSFFYFLYFSRFDIIPGDEGYFNLACARILRGELPYRDFFLHTPPFSYMVQAVIFKLFGESLIIGRITTVFIGTGVTLMIFAVSSRLIKGFFAMIPPALFIFWGVGHIPYPSFNWYGTLEAFVIMISVLKFIDSRSRGYLAAAGIFTGLLCFTKQNLGAASIAATAAFILMYRTVRGDKDRALNDCLKDMLYFVSGGLIAAAPFFIYFVREGFSRQAIYYLLKFSYGSAKMRMDIFPFPHLKPASFVALGIYCYLGFLLFRIRGKASCKKWVLGTGLVVLALFFLCLGMGPDARLRLFDHIKEGFLNGFFNLPALSIILAGAGLTVSFLKEKRLGNESSRMAYVAIFALIYIWLSLMISRDMIHLIPTMPVAYPLYGFVSVNIYRRIMPGTGNNKGFFWFFPVLPVIFFCALGLYINLQNETFRFSSSPITGMNYSMRSPGAEWLLVGRSRGEDIDRLVEHIRSNVPYNEKIFLYNIDSTIYMLSDRMPGTFNTLFIPNAFMPKDQERVIGDIERHGIKFIAADKKFYDPYIEGGYKDDKGLTGSIKRFIRLNYAVEQNIGTYNFLTRNKK